MFLIIMHIRLVIGENVRPNNNPWEALGDGPHHVGVGLVWVHNVGVGLVWVHSVGVGLVWVHSVGVGL